MEKITPMPSIYYPDFIAANQSDRYTHTDIHTHTHTHTLTPCSLSITPTSSQPTKSTGVCVRVSVCAVDTVVTLLLHRCHIFVTLLLHCCYTVVTLPSIYYPDFIETDQSDRYVCVCCLLPAVYCLMSAACCLLSAVCCLLSAVYYLTPQPLLF
jgi:hypothetical protein